MGYSLEISKAMGHSLGVSALPNGTRSKAFPTHITYGFSLGKNSSQTQREMARKFIQANVNAIAQRKLELDDEDGLLAANRNVSIPPESSRRLAALYTSFYEQRQNYSKEWPGYYDGLSLKKEIHSTSASDTHSYAEHSQSSQMAT